MTDHIGERACQLAVYMIENRATVRAAAKKFGISKSTVHKDLSERLERIDRTLYAQVRKSSSRTRQSATSAAATLHAGNTRKTGTNPICPRGLFVRGGQIFWCSKNL